MASNYGPHFGVRRWDEDIAVREGRYKTPASGDPLLTGSAVVIDFTAPGFMAKAADGELLRPGVSGLLIWEDQFLQFGAFGSINAPIRRDMSQLAHAGLGKYAVIGGGAGSKFWYRDMPARTTPDGFPFPAISPVDGLVYGGVGATVALGDYLGWSGTQWETVSGSGIPAAAWLQVVTLDSTAGYLEATLIR